MSIVARGNAFDAYVGKSEVG